MTTKSNLSVGTDQAPLATEKPETKAGSPGEIVKGIFRWEASGVLVALIILCAILAIASPNFLTAFNLTVVIREASFVGLVALGQTLVLLLGGIDLSVGAAAGLSAIVGCLFLKSLGIPPWLVIPATAVFGLCIGSISGFFISVLKLNPFIVTLAMWEIFAGMTLVITKGYPIRPLGPAFTVYGPGRIFWHSRTGSAFPRFRGGPCMGACQDSVWTESLRNRRKPGCGSPCGYSGGAG